jgi:hypothetical protein
VASLIETMLRALARLGGSAVAGKVNATPAESPPDSRIAPIEANLLAANLAPL